MALGVWRDTSPHVSPTFVARVSRCRCDKAHGPKYAEGVVDTTSKRLEGVRLVTGEQIGARSRKLVKYAG